MNVGHVKSINSLTVKELPFCAILTCLLFVELFPMLIFKNFIFLNFLFMKKAFSNTIKLLSQFLLV